MPHRGGTVKSLFPHPVYLARKTGLLKTAGLLLTLLFLGFAPVEQEYPDGLYFILPCSRYSDRPMPVAISLITQSVCLADQPFLGASAVESVSILYEAHDENLIFFDITLSSKAFETLQKITSASDVQTFALISGGGVLCLFFWNEEKPNRILRIESRSGSRKVQQAHKQLSARFSMPG
jgi:hypothetical protein